MASPNFDELHARFSRAIEDPITAATAASDGEMITSATRTDYLMRAINEFAQEVYRLIGKDRTRKFLQEMVVEEAIGSISSSGVSLSALYQNLPLEFVKTGNTYRYIFSPSKSRLDGYRDPHVDYAFAIEGGKIYVYELGVAMNAGAGTLAHIGYSSALTANHASLDTTLPKQYWDAVVELAVSQFYLDLNLPDKAVRDRYTAMLTLLAKGAE